MEKLLTYALLNDKLVHVSNVKNGLECGCLCPKCLSNLIAKNNPSNKKISHFAHFKDKACKGAYETALHLLAKEVLFEQKRILLPDFHFDYQARNPESLYTEGSVIEFEEIYI